MAMSVGTAAIAVDGAGAMSVTGAGMAKAIADAMVASGGSVHSRVAEMLVSITDPAVRAAVFPGIGSFYEKLAHDVALGVINHLTTNAHAVVTPSIAVGRMPAATTPGTPISPPLANVEIPIQ